MSVVEEFFKAITEADVETLATKFGNLGELINVPHPVTGGTALHYTAAYRMRQVFNWLVKQPGLDYLARDGQGRLASALAYEVANYPAMGRYLATKQVNQAHARGIDTRTLFAPLPN